jgi:predicted permease
LASGVLLSSTEIIMPTLFADLHYALRQLRRSPGFAFTAILTLTMAIAANVVVFGVVNALLLHPLPVPEANRVFTIQGKATDSNAFSYPNYRDIRDRNQTFSDVSLFRLARIGFDATGTAQPVWGYEVSGNYFRMLGVQPALGRFFTPEEDTKINGEPYVVLSYDCWKTRLNGDPQIIGKAIRLNKLAFVVIGVAPRHFYGTERVIWPELWLPVHDQPEIEGYNLLVHRGDSGSWVVGRLKPGVTPQQADADLANVATQLAREYADEDGKITMRVTRPGFLGDGLGRPIHAFLFGILLMAFLVLLAACANLGGLFSARMTDRARELGIRIAIGASRRRLLRQLLTESIFLAVFGGFVAALFSALLLQALSQWRPSPDFPLQVLVEPTGALYLFAFLLALFTGSLFGLLPARQIWRTDPNHTLKTSSTEAAHRKFSLRDILLVVQVALCCLLVTASFVALRGLARTFHMPLGIRPEGVTLASADVHLAGYQNAGQIQQRLLDAVRQIPGIESATLANSTPLSLNQNTNSIYAPGTSAFNAASIKFSAYYYEVTPGYFHAAGTRLLDGRDFTAHDDAHSPNVAIVNETFAKRLFGTVDVVGKTYPTQPGKSMLIVGVVEDGRYQTLTEDPAPALFWPIAQAGDNDTVLLVRSPRLASEMIPAVRRAIAGVDPAIPVFTINTWSDTLSLATLPARAATVALGVLGGLAMMLAVTGVFGMASYTVSRRMRELGIRVALGAQNRDILRAALGRMVMLLGIGSLAGLGLGFAAGKVLASIVYQATASDPLVIFAVVATMVLVGMLSAAWPARRALHAEPAHLLRSE